MKSIKRILVPTDFSEGSETAYPVAHKLALKFGAEIDMIHVVPSIKSFIKFMASDMDMEYTDKLVSDAKQRIESAMSNFEEESKGEYFIKMDRKPWNSLLEHIQNRDYDLVVMGAIGGHETKMKRGGVTQQTIRNSPVPVLAVDSEMMRRGVNKILVPTDGSELSFMALRSAAIMAEAFGSEITLFYVSEMSTGLSDTAHFVPNKIKKDEVYQELIKKIEKYIVRNSGRDFTLERGDKLFEDVLLIRSGDKMKPIALKTVIITGFSASYEIENYAEENSDLVVMATHGYSGFAHVFLGSVTEKVLQHVNKPVMTVRPGEAEFMKSDKNTGKLSVDPLP
ncbi:MAG: universal stress protein [Balneolaceae bacterium]|nr:MAG: universal stress protein [Balneolaceae bacterium]